MKHRLVILAGEPPEPGHLRGRPPYSLGTGDVDGLAPFPAVVTGLGDEALVGVGLAAHFTVILDHGRRVIVEL